jgi:hypothetical protein
MLPDVTPHVTHSVSPEGRQRSALCYSILPCVLYKLAFHVSRLILGRYTTLVPVAAQSKEPHKRTVLTAQLDRECTENSVRCTVKISRLCNCRNSGRCNCAFHVGRQCRLFPQANLSQFGLRI